MPAAAKPETAEMSDAEIVEAYLTASMIPDPDAAAAYMKPGTIITFTGGREFDRDRQAEFHASGTYAELAKRYNAWITALREVLSNAGQDAFERLAEPPTEFRGSFGDLPDSGRKGVARYESPVLTAHSADPN